MKIIYDNSNLNESYSGIVSPLTSSFARRVYEQVYIQFCLFMGVSQSVVDSHGKLFSQMVTTIGGHMYYNLKNWHTMIAFFPGYQLNGPFLEEMMGIPKEYRGQVAVVSTKSQRWISKLTVIWLIFRIGSIFLTMPIWVAMFNRRFFRGFNRLKAKLSRPLKYNQLAAMYTDAERIFTSDFSVPIANDFAVMISVGLLKKLSRLYFNDQNDQIANLFISGNPGIKSAEPGKAMYEIVQQINADPALVQLIHKSSTSQLMLILKDKHPNLAGMVDRFILDYGDRVPGELKLESVTFTNHPEVFLKMLKMQLVSTLHQKQKPSAKKIGTDPAQFIYALPLVRRIIFSCVYYWVQKSVTIREDTRFKRTLIFAMARQIFIVLGKQLVNARKLTKMEDVFYLTVEQLLQAQLVPKTEVLQLVEQAKKEAEECQHLQMPRRLVCENGVINLDDFRVEADKGSTTVRKIHGVVASIGTQGKAVFGDLIVTDYFDPEVDYRGKILVTRFTDPGWTIIFPLLKGLVVERGGMLSHAAIVAREYQIPCIINAVNAVDVLRNRKTATMDMVSGMVR